jgi:hypothetical protein
MNEACQLTKTFFAYKIKNEVQKKCSTIHDLKKTILKMFMIIYDTLATLRYLNYSVLSG